MSVQIVVWYYYTTSNNSAYHHPTTSREKIIRRSVSDAFSVCVVYSLAVYCPAMRALVL